MLWAESPLWVIILVVLPQYLLLPPQIFGGGGECNSLWGWGQHWVQRHSHWPTGWVAHWSESGGGGSAPSPSPSTWGGSQRPSPATYKIASQSLLWDGALGNCPACCLLPLALTLEPQLFCCLGSTSQHGNELFLCQKHQLCLMISIPFLRSLDPGYGIFWRNS